MHRVSAHHFLSSSNSFPFSSFLPPALPVSLSPPSLQLSPSPSLSLSFSSSLPLSLPPTHHHRQKRATRDMWLGVGHSRKHSEEGTVKTGLQVESGQTRQLKWPIIHSPQLLRLLFNLVWQKKGEDPLISMPRIISGFNTEGAPGYI